MAGGLVLTTTLVMLAPKTAGATDALRGHGVHGERKRILARQLVRRRVLLRDRCAPGADDCDANFTGPVLGVAPTADHLGFWEYDATGQLACFGDAGFYGDLNGPRPNSPIVGSVATPDGEGYDFVAANGGVFAFGDAYFYGSEGGQTLPKPIAGITEFPIGQLESSGGYWLFSTTGHVYPFGSAQSYGMVNTRHPVVALASTADGLGYWMTESNGASPVTEMRLATDRPQQRLTILWSPWSPHRTIGVTGRSTLQGPSSRTVTLCPTGTLHRR